MHIFVSEAHGTTQQRHTAIPALTSDKANGPMHSPWRVQRHLRHAFFRQVLQPSNDAIQARSWRRIVIATRLKGVGLSSAQGNGANIYDDIK